MSEDVQALPCGTETRSALAATGAWIGLCLILAVGCSGDAPTTHLEKPGKSPDQVLWDFTTTESDSGRLQWILEAEQAFFYQKAKKVEAVGLEVDMYGDSGLLSSSLTADSGSMDRKSGDMTARGNVHVVSRDDYELWTNVLHWDRERELFHTEAFVEVRHGENLYSGYDMECDQRLEHLHIQREPRGVIIQNSEAQDD